MTLNITIKTEPAQTEILVDGDLDQVSLRKDFWLMLSTAEQQTVENSQHIVFCLEAVSHVDTAGLAWTINALADFSKHNINVSIKNLPEKLLNLAKLSNADSLLSID
ncbi:lipid asymmetry maintenance protein MlaB [Glaciecola sp. KUL10]|uniref:STAS domain-containing protein n=1 Tax=Glaciecola sp. (strain KUL10) TaxID=2161813 RepID=UPI000D782473|nr:STAS domain-containing protein [Glaciecola sp. KUL10]GBL04888.1 STAS domain protein [Glaciecola sp. KUL10]